MNQETIRYNARFDAYQSIAYIKGHLESIRRDDGTRLECPDFRSNNDMRRIFLAEQRERLDERETRDKLAARARFAARVAKCANADGDVAIVVSGMDCDCVKFTWSHVAPAVPLAIEHFINHSNYWADGPQSVHVVPVDDAPESYSHDLALEAFEDGHPHVVYA